MSIQTEPRHCSISSQEEEDDEKFIAESTELAKSFTELFIITQRNSGDTKKSPLVGHENKPAPTEPTEEAFVASVPLPMGANVVPVAPPNVSDPRSLAVANSLDRVSEKVNNKLHASFAHSQAQVIEQRDRTIWDIGYEDFRTIMHGVFTSLDESVVERSSGWEMAALVYRGVAGLVSDLRQQSGSQNHASTARESTLQSYAGNFLEEIGLMTWITGQGGLSYWGRREHGEQYRLPTMQDVSGTSV